MSSNFEHADTDIKNYGDEYQPGKTDRTAIIGFPFETITSREVRDLLMKQILNYFETK